MPTYRLTIAYDGSDFHGYSRQPVVRTVQGVLEDALFRHTGVIDTEVAGRTDAGVHASHQVVSFSCERDLDMHIVARSMNRQLGGEVAVLAMARVDEGFSARFSATGRRYEYLVWNAPAPDPFRRTRSWHVRDPLDLSAMQAACAPLLGQQDYASFCRKHEGRSTIRHVRYAAWTRSEEHILAFEIEASSYCHQMVRSIVAVLVEVGRGRLTPADMAAILEAGDRSVAKGAAPARGLTLIDVTY